MPVRTYLAMHPSQCPVPSSHTQTQREFVAPSHSDGLPKSADCTTIPQAETQTAAGGGGLADRRLAHVRFQTAVFLQHRETAEAADINGREGRLR